MTEFDNDELAEIEPDPETFHLESDNDGHWYVIQDGYEDDFHQWISDMENNVDSEFDFEDCRTYGSPSLVHFGAYWIEGE